MFRRGNRPGGMPWRARLADTLGVATWISVRGWIDESAVSTPGTSARNTSIRSFFPVDDDNCDGQSIDTLLVR